MQIQVNSDSSINASAGLAAYVEENVSGILARFAEQISRVEIHLSDLDGDRTGGNDKRCLLEARTAGMDPVAVTDESTTIEQAVRGAARKMERLLDSRYGKLEARRQ
jgi:ribosome-associated translation inhibitor RaiA